MPHLIIKTYDKKEGCVMYDTIDAAMEAVPKWEALDGVVEVKIVGAVR